jgi:uncharacterized membrane-anchored protein
MKKIIFWLTLIIIIIFVNFLVVRKENVIKHGQTVLLKLAPKDPRALMQGDYMRLRYTIADNLNKTLHLYRRASSTGKTNEPEIKSDGYLILELETNSVAKFVKIYAGETLLSNQCLIYYRNRRGIKIGAEKFFFKEGEENIYSKAKYGELKIDASGKSVLVGLRDKSLNKLGRDRFKN